MYLVWNIIRLPLVAFLKAGLDGLVWIGQAKPNLSDQNVILVFVVGGMNGIEVLEAQEALSESGRVDVEVVLGGTTFLTLPICLIRRVVPLDGRFEHVVLFCTSTPDHAIIWIDREVKRALDLYSRRDENPTSFKSQCLTQYIL
ncbi:putative Sec1-like, domain 2, Sec1-like superfamily protein [Helianthus annuus]|uniref:Putative sec1-like protein n=1 Tax=Helianthus annuus TaxID=4232 RepID=A0A251TVP4_HELAN|nr:putative Sec1-like, domain 2, Sec1-like superfamily protein [Helianthus annuus]KAJ0892652.1 putative Sec1-like, domain 2, Sec1-like superfamily protein [Helianthus annuus]